MLWQWPLPPQTIDPRRPPPPPPPPPMDPSLSKCASDIVSESLILRNVSSPNDATGCNDPSISRQTLVTEMLEFSLQQLLKSKEYRPEEFLVQDFNCAFQDSILFQVLCFLRGHMYLFAHFICFYSNIFGFETSTSLHHSFLVMKLTNSLMMDGCSMVMEAMKLQNSSKENGFVAIEKVSSFKTLINDMESRDGGEDVSTTNNFKVPSTSANDTEVGPESIINTNSSTPTDTCFLVPENCDALTVPDYFIKVAETKFPVVNFPDYFIKVAETKFPIKVDEFFNLYFSDNAINFIKSFHRRRGDKEFKCSSWCLHDKFGHVRDISYQHPIKVYLGAKFCSCKESQKFQIYRNSHWVLETSQEVNDVPYGDYFRVEGFWDVERDSDGPVEGCISRVYVNVAFNKKTVWKGKIVKSTLEECQEAYATWLDMARELLKQNIDKQGGVDPSGSSTENGGHQIENKVATIEEPLERSQNLSDPVRTLQMSTFMDVNQRIANLLQGTLSNASSIASFLSKFLRKSFSYSKRQGHISLLLAVAFAVIFLMQASIVVLLKKPQQVLVRYPVTYMGSAGGGAGERQAEAVAWLEKRMHELKEQMAMVESLLERMRYEHAALKAQLEQLGVEG